jgi:hypothetical protein
MARPALLRARAFLERKATVLLDHAGPDLGHPAICLAITGDDRLPALVLAIVLARAGFRIVTPLLDLAALETVAVIRDVAPALTIVVRDNPAGRHIAALTDLLPGQEVAVWSPLGNDGAPPSSLRHLPASPTDAAQALRHER